MRFLRAARLRSALAGRPRSNFGKVAFSCRRTLLTALRTALFSSAMTWNSQSGWRTGPKTWAIGPGYSDEPSVVMPFRLSRRRVKASWNR